MDAQEQGGQVADPGITPAGAPMAEGAVHRTGDIRLSVAAGLLALFDIKSPHLGVHCRSVARWCRGMGVLVGMTQEELLELELAGLLHDLGFLVKIQKLPESPAEARAADESLLRHPDIGHAALSRIDGFAGIADAVLHHHERFDGEGYPHHLRGHRIPLNARIIAIADLYDMARLPGVVSSNSDERLARKTVQDNSGKSLDPELVEQFITLLTSLEESPSGASANEMEITVRALRPGMLLARDLRSANNLLLLRADTVLTPEIINRVLSATSTDRRTTTAFVDIRSIREEDLMRQVKREEMMLRVEMLATKPSRAEQKPEILVVDDFLAVCNALRRELGQEGMNVTGVTSIESGLRVLSGRRIDAVITDIAIGKTDGFTLLREIKQKYPGLFCVVLSGFPTPDNIRALKEFDNVVRFVAKPWSAPILLAAVQEALKRAVPRLPE